VEEGDAASNTLVDAVAAPSNLKPNTTPLTRFDSKKYDWAPVDSATAWDNHTSSSTCWDRIEPKPVRILNHRVVKNPAVSSSSARVMMDSSTTFGSGNTSHQAVVPACTSNRSCSQLQTRPKCLPGNVNLPLTNYCSSVTASDCPTAKKKSYKQIQAECKAATAVLKTRRNSRKQSQKRNNRRIRKMMGIRSMNPLSKGAVHDTNSTSHEEDTLEATRLMYLKKIEVREHEIEKRRDLLSLQSKMDMQNQIIE